MRRLMAATVFAVLCATATACSDSGDSPSAATSAATSAPTSAATSAAKAAGGSGNTKQVCADVQKVITDATTKFSQELVKLTTAKGDDAAAVRTIKTLFNEWAAGIREQAAKATDAQLKTALNDAADQLAKVADSIKSTANLAQADKMLDAPEVQAAEAKFESLCG